MRLFVAGLLSPTLVHFMPTTLTMMPMKPINTEMTIKARHVWMCTRDIGKGEKKRRKGVEITCTGLDERWRPGAHRVEWSHWKWSLSQIDPVAVSFLMTLPVIPAHLPSIILFVEVPS